MKRNSVIAITGPTASSKTRRAVAVARKLGAEIVSADSRQVYKDMDIGTGKDLDDYGEVPYHLIDVCEAGEKYNLYRYLRDYDLVIDDIYQRGKMAVVCGGSGMYLEAAITGTVLPRVSRNNELRNRLEGLSLEELAQMLGSMKRMHNTTDVDSKARAIRAIEIEHYYQEHPEERPQQGRRQRDISAIIVGIDIPREARRRKISERLATRLQNGMVDEVRRLIEKGVDTDTLEYYGLEYKWLSRYVKGELPFDEMLRNLEIAIHQFAKRQMTWFRGMERRGLVIHWLPYDISDDDFVERVERLIEC